MLEAVLQQVLTKLNELQAEINNMKQTVATKQDLENMVTKEDLKAMATKQDLKMIQQAVLETNEIVKNIEANQKRQERILDVLSKRSIEHEAQITDLRYVK
ncbi:hypothetical protein CI793_01100 [Anoxybacillus ayderensis]|uniref:hypothetical protein n=1 Tax=Anoxybacillus sp. ST70 TaxID=2864180 RepID=UPI000300D804|nr:hypothetical protein [Anoxybacillus sp. ST70]AXM89283.1 hypothetical protein B379_09045 [Anoxybacillus ayderensis G10]MBW9219757.1 hypothetical protein [Anoxybacillus sp. ST70]THD17892.1 hypothetical protein CI793_01100 [Anoxybacillus ayderensis]